MSNSRLFGAGSAPTIPTVKPFAFAILLSAFLLFPLQSLAGGDGKGPGPFHQNQAHNHTHGSEWENIYGVDNLAYYGDWNANRVFVFNVDDMSLLTIVEDTGDGPYGCDQQNQETAYVLTRKAESLTVIENYAIENIGDILLQHRPRSTDFNPATGFSLVSGGDKVMSSIIKVNSDQVVKVVGFDEPAVPHDYGGSLATGHPLWVGDDHFFMLDRPHRQIQLWNRKGELLSLLDTPTSVHHVFQPPKRKMGIYYAVVEGNQPENISPSILKFRVHEGRLMAIGEAVLSDYDPVNLDPSVMGSHHADFHPDGVHIYIGSAEGHVFVVNRHSMDIVAMIESGLGSGHTTFVPEKGLAFVTNHNDTFMTVVDTTSHTLLTNIQVATVPPPTLKSQAHTSSVSPDSKYFYSAASHDGVFFQIDTDTLQVSGFVDLEADLGEDVNILMGSFVWGGESDGGM